jgi:YjbE family integral membrane protein
LDLHFLCNALSIVLIDLILGGDNAVVIALAVRALPQRQRLRGIALGAGAAVLLRVAITYFAARLLQVRFIQLSGGILIFWIAVKLFSSAEDNGAADMDLNSFWRAIAYIVVADLTMSTDNVLAVAAASHGDLRLLLFGLGLSIPFVVVTSSLLSRLMDRIPAIVYLGAAILGKVGAEMILTDAWMLHQWSPTTWQRYAIEGCAALAIALTGFATSRRHADSLVPATAGRDRAASRR